jgi:hypothetical protein
MKKKDDTPIEKQLFRYLVELRDLRDETTRTLPITFVKRILLASKNKTGAQEPPPELRLRAEDGGRIWDASDVEDLARQLREHYPDGKFERTLKRERDFAAEERYWSATEGLARIIARAAVENELHKTGVSL